MLNLVSFFGFFASLPLGSIHSIGHSGMTRVHRHVLQAPSVSSKTHVKRYCISISILPVRDAGGDLEVGLVLGGNFAARRAHDYRWLLCDGKRYFLVLMTWRLERVIRHIRNLDDALYS